MTRLKPQLVANQTRLPPAGAWLLLSPLLLWLALFVVTPTIVLLFYSVCQLDDLGQVKFSFSLGNYGRAFHGTYAVIVVRSLKYAAITTILCAIIGYPVAFFIGRTGPRLRNHLLLMVMIPFLTSFLIRAYAWVIILRSHGVLNGFLESTRIIPIVLSNRIELLYSPAAVIIGLVYTYLPFMILPIYGSVEKLDQTLVEAASDLGAGPMRAFCRVILPLTWPGVAAGILLVFVPSIAMFAVSNIMSGGKIRLIGDEIEDQFHSSGDLPFGATLGILLLALFLLSFLLFPGRRRE